MPVNIAPYSVSNQQKYNRTSFCSENKKAANTKESSADAVNMHMHVGLFKDKVSGSINGKDFNVVIKPRFFGHKIIGVINGKSFELKDKLHNIVGSFDGKPIEIKVKNENIFTRTSSLIGKIGDKNIDLICDKGFFHRNLNGKLNDKEVDIDLAAGLFGKTTIKGETGEGHSDLKIKNSGFFKNGRDITGKYNGSDELFPILLSSHLAQQDSITNGIILLA